MRLDWLTPNPLHTADLLSSTNNFVMGIFDKFFNRNRLSENKLPERTNIYEKLESTAEMLPEDFYWKLVNDSLEKTNTPETQEYYLVKQIEKLSPKEIIGFRLRTDKLLYDTYNSEMWCAAYIMNGGCSDDMFEYFRNWVISRGKATFYNAKENPDSLIYEYDAGIQFYEFEDFWYVALKAYKRKTGKELYDYISEDFKTTEGNYPNIEFNWSEEKPESMKKICPRLFENIWQ